MCLLKIGFSRSLLRSVDRLLVWLDDLGNVVLHGGLDRRFAPREGLLELEGLHRRRVDRRFKVVVPSV